MSLRLRLLLFLPLMLSAALLLIVPLEESLEKRSRIVGELVSREFPAQHRWQEMRQMLWDSKGLIANYLLSERVVWLERYQRQKNGLQDHLAAAESSPGYQAVPGLVQLRRELAAYYAEMDEVIDAQGKGRPEIARRILFARGYYALVPVNRRLRALAGLTQGRIRRLESQQTAAGRRMVGAFALAGSVFGVAALLLVVMSGDVVRRLSRMEQALKLVSKGALTHRLPGAGRDEIAGIERSFNLMAAGLKRSRDRLRRLGQVDGLTGTFNRRFLREQIARLGKRRLVGYILFDIDHFKIYNDKNGHPAGDGALKQVADIAKSCCKPRDLLVRYGGEEFLVLVPAGNLAATRRKAEQLRRKIYRGTFAGEDKLPGGRLSVSVGVAAGRGDVRQLIEAADQALYRAKRGGRNRVS